MCTPTRGRGGRGTTPPIGHKLRDVSPFINIRPGSRIGVESAKVLAMRWQHRQRADDEIEKMLTGMDPLCNRSCFV
ncbi:hypothetical protein JTE90_006869 [Oedothorax gibbosus]|uniref:Uncharacterized protein n=1 Tax=Oedothorax gibbosus TaxID=931172 RepID=A0AAV6UIN0_9ARAC|nr:hypothetical protein JTE90_006869 [Oedothorax gibbosus]